MNFNNSLLYKFKPTLKVAQLLIRLVIKVEKIREEELKRFQPLHEEYLKSENYIKL